MTINLSRLGLTAACAAMLLAAGACDRLERNKGEPAAVASATDTTAAEKAVAEAKADAVPADAETEAVAPATDPATAEAAPAAETATEEKK